MQLEFSIISKYFDIKKTSSDDSQEKKKIGKTYENINVVLGSFITSLTLAMALTPLDLVIFR